MTTNSIVAGRLGHDQANGKWLQVAQGERHAWCNPSETPLRMLVVFSPGRIEGMATWFLAKSRPSGIESRHIDTTIRNFAGFMILGNLDKGARHAAIHAELNTYLLPRTHAGTCNRI